MHLLSKESGSETSKKISKSFIKSRSKALSDFYSPLMGRTICPNEEFLITVGAYYSLYAVTQVTFEHNFYRSFQYRGGAVID